MSDPLPEFDGLIEPILSELGIQPTTWQISKLKSHYDLLRQWSRHMNLTTILQPQQIVRRHFGESLCLSMFIPEEVATLVDVGSGAGFPGIPIAVMKQGFRVTLVESVRKKATFLKEVTRDLGNVQVRALRVEDLEGRFDWATMRALAPVRLLPELTRLAPNLALLVTTEASQELQGYATVEWAAPEPLPWSNRRCLLIGRMRSIG